MSFADLVVPGKEKIAIVGFSDAAGKDTRSDTEYWAE
jgi:hypothetical protein